MTLHQYEMAYSRGIPPSPLSLPFHALCPRPPSIDLSISNQQHPYPSPHPPPFALPSPLSHLSKLHAPNDLLPPAATVPSAAQEVHIRRGAVRLPARCNLLVFTGRLHWHPRIRQQLDSPNVFMRTFDRITRRHFGRSSVAVCQPQFHHHLSYGCAL